MINVTIITNKPVERIETLKHLPYFSDQKKPYLARSFGYGNARNEAATHFGKTGLMLQLNDDLIVNYKILEYAETYHRGEFGFQIVDEWVCSRAFIIHLEDYWSVGGCDPSIKYAFEDGDFYHRATKAGLKFKPIPDCYITHVPHRHAWMSMRNMAAIDCEWAKLFVKYKRNAKRNMIAFFFRPFHWKYIIQHFVLKVIFVNYWLLRGLM